jgi:hypothetical protein
MIYIEKHFKNGVILTLVDIDYQEGGDHPIWRQYNGHLPSTIVKAALIFYDHEYAVDTIHHLKLVENDKPENERSGKVWVRWYDPNGDYEEVDDSPPLDHSYYGDKY